MLIFPTPRPLMVIALTKGVSELYCLSFTRMEACTFCFVPDFVAETQNTSIHDPRIEKCRTPSLDDFVDGDRRAVAVPYQIFEEIPVMDRVHCPGISNHFISTTKRKKRVS